MTSLAVMQWTTQTWTPKWSVHNFNILKLLHAIVYIAAINLHIPWLQLQYASKKSVRKVSNGREITFEVLCDMHEMARMRTTVGSSRLCCQENQYHANNLPAFL